ncbi:MAG: hypothetical protein HWQ44_14185 [Nostoc sp. JL34]|uniref:hypothetical protein n=1 Tax=Nostoc sp. JL34 TaxID=2815397 RepID=UPI001DCDE7BB|nr:hypothetical protein [Nostoc sp. JL34]MBN3884084.1 hypothetical protein [Nostoc sp. JL34]
MNLLYINQSDISGAGGAAIAWRLYPLSLARAVSFHKGKKLIHSDDCIRDGFYCKLQRGFEENPQVD